MKIRVGKNQGMVLILALWILSILAVFAGLSGMRVRQKIAMVSRLEKRDEVHYIAQTGVQLARALLTNRLRDSSGLNVEAMAFVFQQPEVFQKVASDNGSVQVSYLNYDSGITSPVRMFGVQDEERKLNLNTASDKELARLLSVAAGLDEDSAEDIAHAIVDWRSEQDQQISGFYGDEYYSRLNFPYDPKKAPFEVLEEVLLVKGMNPMVFERVRDFLTVYGDGQININTASEPVLQALGLSANMAGMIISARHGADHLPCTDDDRLFADSGASLDVGALGELDPDQLAEIDRLYQDGRLSVFSEIFHIHAEAVLETGQEKRFIDCVVQGRDGKILAWREY